jgi:DNA primase
MQEEEFDVKDALESLGVNRISERGDEVTFSCPQDFHSRGDRNPSASINKNTLAYHCFSCGASGNLYTLVADVQNVSVAIAIRWIREKFYLGKSFEEDKPVTGQLKKLLQNNIPKAQEKTILEDVLKMFSVDWEKAYQSYQNNQLPEKLSRPFKSYDLNLDTINYFDLGYDKTSNRITIPLRNKEGELVAIKGRTSDSDEYPKYLGLGDKEGQARYGFKRINDDSLVFGLDTASENLIICEGEFDAMSLRQKGFTGSVATGTCNATKGQIYNIISKAKSATILFDPDDAGIEGASKLANLLLPHIPVRIATLGQNDPATTSKEDLERIISKAKIPKLNKG